MEEVKKVPDEETGGGRQNTDVYKRQVYIHLAILARRGRRMPS